MFIPLKAEYPTRRLPVMTFILIAANTLVYLYSLAQGVRGYQAIVFQFGLIPVELTHLGEFTPQIPFPIILTPLTSMFIHAGFMHLAGNMLFLWVFGNNIEDSIGSLKFLLFYILAGLIGDALFVLFSPNSQVPMIGASGAIAGVMGAFFVLFPRDRILTLIFLFFFIRLVRLPASIVLGFWIVYQILMSAMGSTAGGGVAWLAHVGGFGFGWIWFKIFSGHGDQRPRIYRVVWR